MENTCVGSSAQKDRPSKKKRERDIRGLSRSRVAYRATCRAINESDASVILVQIKVYVVMKTKPTYISPTLLYEYTPRLRMRYFILHYPKALHISTTGSRAAERLAAIRHSRRGTRATQKVARRLSGSHPPSQSPRVSSSRFRTA
ncbi:hypothetical protein KQX54_006350 [Cotesia glomerata]|uniref:Uncharacterized protein n=1 Tax=Cotesia glomerata TaxID=32391 RepID=A0AAV7I9J5_COTGL|nr:hypothetical protein KQX54_006350 [Cotesia glomerata]